MGDINFVSKGVDVIKQAVELDTAGELEKALNLYMKGLEYLMTGLKYEKNKKSKAVIEGKIKEYLNRAEQIKTEMKGGGKKKKKKVEADDEKGDSEKEKMNSALSSAIVTEKPNVAWDDVAGLEVAKGLLQEAVLLPRKFPQLFVGTRTPWRGILLYGPPGNMQITSQQRFQPY